MDEKKLSAIKADNYLLDCSRKRKEIQVCTQKNLGIHKYFFLLSFDRDIFCIITTCFKYIHKLNQNFAFIELKCCTFLHE